MKKFLQKIRKSNYVVIALAIVLMVIACVIINLLFKGGNKDLEEFNSIVTTLEDGTRFIFGAKKDISFEVDAKDEFSYTVVDEDNNNVELKRKMEKLL